VNDLAVIHSIVPNIQKERCSFAEGASYIAAKFLEQEGRLRCRVRIAGVPEIVAKIVKRGAMNFVGAGLRACRTIMFTI